MSTASSSPVDPAPPPAPEEGEYETHEVSLQLNCTPKQIKSLFVTPYQPPGASNNASSSSSSQANYISNWRDPCPLPTDKLWHILDKQVWHDVKFLVGDPPSAKLLSAHKLILAMSSAVFEAMLYGPLSNAQEEVINIPDVDPTAFNQMLKVGTLTYLVVIIIK